MKARRHHAHGIHVRPSPEPIPSALAASIIECIDDRRVEGLGHQTDNDRIIQDPGIVAELVRGSPDCGAQQRSAWLSGKHDIQSASDDEIRVNVHHGEGH